LALALAAAASPLPAGRFPASRRPMYLSSSNVLGRPVMKTLFFVIFVRGSARVWPNKRKKRVWGDGGHYRVSSEKGATAAALFVSVVLEGRGETRAKPQREARGVGFSDPIGDHAHVSLRRKSCYRW